MALIIINKCPVFFFHIPKTAGTSIKKYFNFPKNCHKTVHEFFSSLENRQIKIQMNDFYGALPLEEQIKKRQEYAEMASRWRAAAHRHPFDQIFKFSFVRNPWDRFASIYYYHRSDFVGITTFEEFVRSLEPSKELDSFLALPAASSLSLTQTQYLSLRPPHCLLPPPPSYWERSCSAIDFVGKVETIQQDIKKICEILCLANWPPLDRLKYNERVSENSNEKYTKIYNNFDLIYAVFDYYYDDVKGFNYTFSGLPDCKITKMCFEKRERINV